jgi:YfiH family protein
MSGLEKNNCGDMSFSEIGTDGLPIIRFPGLSQHEEVFHFITTRIGGYSKRPFNSFNLASHVGDQDEYVLKNRCLLTRSIGIPAENLIFADQVHGDNIFLVNNCKLLESKRRPSGAITSSDSLITDLKDICLLIFVADCTPVLLFDFRKKVIGLVHAGWKGTVSMISQKTSVLMQTNYGCRASDILCAIGPSIGPCCYEVQGDVIDRVKHAFPKEKDLLHSSYNNGKTYFNLWQANKIQLLNSGIPEENVELANLCTNCHHNLFFSSRKDHGNTGRFAAGIMLRQ